MIIKQLLDESRSLRRQLLFDDECSNRNICKEKILNHLQTNKIFIQNVLKEYIHCRNRSKDTILISRNALRLLQSYLSIQITEERNLRQNIQEEIYTCFHEYIIQFIIMQKKQYYNDSKCQLISSQILCNMITDNTKTSNQLLYSTLSWTPSQEQIASTIIMQIGKDDDDNDGNDRYSDDDNTFESLKNNWVDLILNTSNNRQALAAVIACLHNALIATAADGRCDEGKDNNNDHAATSAQLQVADSSLLISTLLRHIAVASSSPPTVSNNNNDETDAVVDDATEWIILLLLYICKCGYLKNMYNSIGRNHVLPEHIVLLHTIQNAVQDTKPCITVLGSDDDNKNNNVIETHIFLVKTLLHISTLQEQTSDNTDCDDYDKSLLYSDELLILEILAETLSEDTIITTKIRSNIGLNYSSSLLPIVLVRMASMLDTWQAKNYNKTSREQEQMSDDTKRYLTTAVRVIGNLCFHCQYNQDLVRTIIIPRQQLSSNDDDNNNDNQLQQQRNGIHILLSMTSMSYVCFTLREWTIVTIRNVLENNITNQEIVAKLQASAPIQNATLHEMGIQINLNPTNGNVSVSPTGINK